MGNKETLETLISKWQKRQIEYQDISVNNSDNEHTSKKFTYKAIATRDCWKELLKFTKQEKQEKVYSEKDMIDFVRFSMAKELTSDRIKNLAECLELFEQQRPKTIYFK